MRQTLQTLIIGEDESYNKHLFNQSGTVAEEIYHLYLVTLEGLVPRYVLAADEDAAASQATCEGKVDCRATVLAVKQIPFRIRGWSALEF